MQYVRWFEDVGLGDVASVGSKVASLGELIRELGPLGVRVPGGFAVTADGYRHFLEAANLGPAIGAALAGLVRADVDDLVARAARIRALIEAAPLPAGLEVQVRHAYRELSRRCAQEGADVAVRSSATAEDSPEAWADMLVATCSEQTTLAAAIDRGASGPALTAQTVTPHPVATTAPN